MKRIFTVAILCLSLCSTLLAAEPVQLARMTTLQAAGGASATGLSPDYGNTGGAGDRTTIITVTKGAGFQFNGSLETVIIDGVNNAGTGYWNANECNGSDTWVLFDFGSGKTVLITEAKFYQADTTTHGTYQWAGSNNGSTFTDVGSTFAWGAAATQTQTELSGNSTEYRYYRAMCVSGANSSGPYLYEIEFKIDGY